MECTLGHAVCLRASRALAWSAPATPPQERFSGKRRSDPCRIHPACTMNEHATNSEKHHCPKVCIVWSARSITQAACAPHVCWYCLRQQYHRRATIGLATQRPMSNTPSRKNEPYNHSEQHHRTADWSVCRVCPTTHAACARHTRWNGLPQQHHHGGDCLASDSLTRATHAQQTQRTTHRIRAP